MTIFSTYSTGENRVTASILAVLRAIALPRAERLLGGLMEQPDFELVRFQNQPAKGGKGVPDAAITASVRLLVETKVTRNAVNAEQLRRHLERLDEADETTKRLLVITPDESQPGAVEAMGDGRVVWASFAALDQAIDELLGDKAEVVSEREAFLLRELQGMLADEELLGSANDVVVVAARRAWGWYQKYAAYICQPGRTFQRTERMAFYSQGQIYPAVPMILEVHDHVVVRHGQHGQLGLLMDRVVAEPGFEEHHPQDLHLVALRGS